MLSPFSPFSRLSENPRALLSSHSALALSLADRLSACAQWALVLAGVSDFARPAEKLSLTQNGALTATGFIWTRWCLIIKPKNYLLAAVNFFLGIVGVVQVSRILMWQSSQKDKTLAEEVNDEVKDAVKTS